MLKDEISAIFADKSPKPNKYTIAIGNQIRKAREEAEYSQAELARLLYIRRATLSAIENGKADIDAVTLSLLAFCVQKPLSFFFPNSLFGVIQMGEPDEIEQELLISFRMLSDQDQKKIIAQIKAIKNL